MNPGRSLSVAAGPAGRRTSRRVLLRRGFVLAAIAAGAPMPTKIAANGERSVDPYGPLEAPDENGLRLPPGFRSRAVARSGDRVGGSDYVWHDQPDGGACFETSDGFVYVSNSEIGSDRGGVGAIRFDRNGEVSDAYRILDGTNRNCSGGVTPWRTWLSCEEFGPASQVHECDPMGEREALPLPALGSFNHEAVEVVASARALFLSEDHREGRFYRFLPAQWPSLDAGRLQAAFVHDDGSVDWVDVSPDEPARGQDTSPFAGGEGLASWNGQVFLATKIDKRIWRYDIAASRIEVVHDCIEAPDTILDSVDNLSVDSATGDLFVAEDGATQDLAVISTRRATGALVIAGMLQFVGHHGSEVAGPAMSPDRSTLMVSSQRGVGGRGITYAITGPFRDAIFNGADPTPLRSARRLSLR